MPVVTAVGTARNGRVDVSLDGHPWRRLPVEVVARTGLGVGSELDRERLRELGRELRRVESLATATRALRHRDHSARSLDERLARAGVRASEREQALATLQRVGWVDDERVARGRAELLAERLWGDEAIAADLARRGIDAEAADAAIAALPPERERAEAAAAARGRGARTAAYLARRGFGEDAVEAVAGSSIAEED
jgi:regulatory protein